MAAGNLRGFYVVLVLIAVVGGGAIYVAKGKKAAGPTTIALTADTSAVPTYVMGSESAPIEVQEYADFECPFCREFAMVTFPDIRDRLVNTGRIRWRFRNMPLQQHQSTLSAHQAAACAGEQGKFWEMHDQLYIKQPEWTTARNPEKKEREYAGKVGLDLNKYDACVSSNRYIERLKADGRRASLAGINSTPTIVVGNTKLESTAYDAIKHAVDSLSPPPKKT